MRIRANDQCTLTKSAPARITWGVDLISDVLPFGRLWHDGPNAVANAIGYAKHYSWSQNAAATVASEEAETKRIHSVRCAQAAMSVLCTAADSALTAFVELERQVLTVTFYLESIQ